RSAGQWRTGEGCPVLDVGGRRRLVSPGTAGKTEKGLPSDVSIRAGTVLDRAGRSGHGGRARERRGNTADLLLRPMDVEAPSAGAGTRDGRPDPHPGCIRAALPRNEGEPGGWPDHLGEAGRNVRGNRAGDLFDGLATGGSVPSAPGKPGAKGIVPG